MLVRHQPFAYKPFTWHTLFTAKALEFMLLKELLANLEPNIQELWCCLFYPKLYGALSAPFTPGFLRSTGVLRHPYYRELWWTFAPQQLLEFNPAMALLELHLTKFGLHLCILSYSFSYFTPTLFDRPAPPLSRRIDCLVHRGSGCFVCVAILAAHLQCRRIEYRGGTTPRVS